MGEKKGLRYEKWRETRLVNIEAQASKGMTHHSVEMRGVPHKGMELRILFSHLIHLCSASRPFFQPSIGRTPLSYTNKGSKQGE